MGFKVGFDTNGVIHKEARPGVPKWRVCTRGINLIGICQNEKCEAKKQKVVVQMPGETEFDFIEEKELLCPMCKKPLERTSNVIFYKCKFKFKGLKYNFEEDKEEEKKSEGDSWNGLTVFNPVSENEDVNDDRWLELKVTVETRKD